MLPVYGTSEEINFGIEKTFLRPNERKHITNMRESVVSIVYQEKTSEKQATSFKDKLKVRQIEFYTE